MENQQIDKQLDLRRRLEEWREKRNLEKQAKRPLSQIQNQLETRDKINHDKPVTKYALDVKKTAKSVDIKPTLKTSRSALNLSSKQTSTKSVNSHSSRSKENIANPVVIDHSSAPKQNSAKLMVKPTQPLTKRTQSLMKPTQSSMAKSRPTKTLSKSASKLPIKQPAKSRLRSSQEKQRIVHLFKNRNHEWYLSNSAKIQVRGKLIQMEIPYWNLVTYQDAKHAAMNGQFDVARVMYHLVANVPEIPQNHKKLQWKQSSNQVESFTKNGKLHFRTSKALNADFWMEWAKLEETLFNLPNAICLLDQAELLADDILVLNKIQSERRKLKLSRIPTPVKKTPKHQQETMLKPILKQQEEKLKQQEESPMRMFEEEFLIKKTPKQVSFEVYREPEEEEEDTPPPKSRFLDDEVSPFDMDQVKKHINFTPKNIIRTKLGAPLRVPTPRQPKNSKEIIQDIAPMLQQMSLNEAELSSKKPVSCMQKSLKEYMSPVVKKPVSELKKSGVKFAEHGSTVTLLTPVRANRKEKQVFGVDSVVTPVRRSARLFVEEEYANGELNEQERLTRLLEEHGYAFVPNSTLLNDCDQTPRPVRMDNDKTPRAVKMDNDKTPRAVNMDYNKTPKAVKMDYDQTPRPIRMDNDKTPRPVKMDYDKTPTN